MVFDESLPLFLFDLSVSVVTTFVLFSIGAWLYTRFRQIRRRVNDDTSPRDRT